MWNGRLRKVVKGLCWGGKCHHGHQCHRFCFPDLLPLPRGKPRLSPWVGGLGFKQQDSRSAVMGWVRLSCLAVSGMGLNVLLDTEVFHLSNHLPTQWKLWDWSIQLWAPEGWWLIRGDTGGGRGSWGADGGRPLEMDLHHSFNCRVSFSCQGIFPGNYPVSFFFSLWLGTRLAFPARTDRQTLLMIEKVMTSAAQLSGGTFKGFFQVSKLTGSWGNTALGVWGGVVEVAALTIRNIISTKIKKMLLLTMCQADVLPCRESLSRPDVNWCLSSGRTSLASATVEDDNWPHPNVLGSHDHLIHFLVASWLQEVKRYVGNNHGTSEEHETWVKVKVMSFKTMSDWWVRVSEDYTLTRVNRWLNNKRKWGVWMSEGYEWQLWIRIIYEGVMGMSAMNECEGVLMETGNCEIVRDIMIM